MIDNVDALIRQGFRIPTDLIGKKTASSIGLIKTKKLLKVNGKKSISIIHYNEVDEFLEHFGVLGMHWGIRNDKEKQAHREARAKKFETKARDIQNQINDVKNDRSFDNFYKTGTLQELSRKKQTALSDAEKSRQGKLTSGKKKALIIGGVAAATLAAYGTYQLANSGELRRSVERGKVFITGSKSPIFKTNPDLASSDLDANGILEKVVKHINPNYGSPGSKLNCRRATFAYEMRRRGHDVQATRTLNGRGQAWGGVYNAITPDSKKFIPGGKYQTFARLKREARNVERGHISPFAKSAMDFSERRISHDQIFSSLRKMPNGARGEVFLKWRAGGAHSVAWEVIKGKPHIIDAQTGKMFSDVKEVQKYYSGLQPLAKKMFGTDVISDAAITRLDNVKLNTNFLLRWLKNA